MSKIVDPYEALGVSRSSDEATIKRAYRALAKEHHPDKSGGNEERFHEVQAAYEILADPERRKEWEEQQRTRRALEEFYVMGGEELRGEDVHTSFTLTLAEAVPGREVQISFKDMMRCENCDGLGADPAAGMMACPTCGGSGRDYDQSGFMRSTVPCHRCNGSGSIAVKICGVCSGRRFVMGKRSVRVRIPAGTYQGQTLRVGGKGRDGLRENGDLFLALKVETPAGYKRRGRGHDLIAEQKISITDAVLGGDVDIRDPLGKVLKVRVPPSSSSGKMIRLTGYGMTAPGKKRGDLYVRLQIQVPDNLSHKERKLYLEIAALEGEKEEGLGEGSAPEQ